MLGKVSIHLKRNVDVFHLPVGLGVIPDIDRHHLVIQYEADVVYTAAVALEIPRQMVPDTRRRHLAWKRGRNPLRVLRIPDVPTILIFVIALATPDEALATEALV